MNLQSYNNLKTLMCTPEDTVVDLVLSMVVVFNPHAAFILNLFINQVLKKTLPKNHAIETQKHNLDYLLTWNKPLSCLPTQKILQEVCSINTFFLHVLLLSRDAAKVRLVCVL